MIDRLVLIILGFCLWIWLGYRTNLHFINRLLLCFIIVNKLVIKFEYFFHPLSFRDFLFVVLRDQCEAVILKTFFNRGRRCIIEVPQEVGARPTVIFCAGRFASMVCVRSVWPCSVECKVKNDWNQSHMLSVCYYWILCYRITIASLNSHMN